MFAGDKRKSMRAGGVLWEGMGLHEDLKRLRLVRGLSNDSGLNNCFLNVVIQGVWHLCSFREALLDLRPQVCPPHILCGVERQMHILFAAPSTSIYLFDYSHRSRASQNVLFKK